jgi:hypothetical protein
MAYIMKRDQKSKPHGGHDEMCAGGQAYSMKPGWLSFLTARHSSSHGTDASEPSLDIAQMVFAFMDDMLADPQQRALGGRRLVGPAAAGGHGIVCRDAWAVLSCRRRHRRIDRSHSDPCFSSLRWSPPRHGVLRKYAFLNAISALMPGVF